MIQENKPCEQGKCPNEFCQCNDDVSFLDPKRLKEQEDKIASGETVCNVDSPEDCENCGS